jgi:hypothetical protein
MVKPRCYSYLMLNYAKVRNQVLFFDDSKFVNTHVTYMKALILAKNDPDLIHLYQVPFHEGDWDLAGIMGHRHRSAILKDLHEARDLLSKEQCLTELTELNRLYYMAGRTTMPSILVEVAA